MASIINCIDTYWKAILHCIKIRNMMMMMMMMIMMVVCVCVCAHIHACVQKTYFKPTKELL